MTLWFTPTVDYVDLNDAKAAIDEAQRAVLFLMFNPGPRDTLLNAIIDLSRATDRPQRLYLKGAINQDPSTSKTRCRSLIRTTWCTANHHMISTGLAYPTYYRALFPDLRKELTAATEQARDSGLGVWASDQTTTGADVTGLDALEDDIVIVPKLFRRLVDYLRLGDDSMAGFRAFLDQAADKFFILSTGHSMTGLDSIVEVNGNNMKMTHPIEDIVFDEK